MPCLEPDVLYEDARLWVLNKPSGALVIRGRGPSAEGPSLLEWASARTGKAYVVHRLDRETSGVLLLAKDADTHRDLCALFEARRVRKTYLAAVQGTVAVEGTVNRPILETGSGRCAVKGAGKPSRTRYRPLEPLGPGATLLEVEPETGRRHQVRVHLYSEGHPVLGDRLYGKPSELSRSAPRLLLHAWAIAFTLRGKRFQATAPLPTDFSEFVGSLRRR